MKFLIEKYGTSSLTNQEDLFDINISDTPKYQYYLNNPNYENKKNKTTSSIEYMTPNEYFEACAEIFKTTFSQQYSQIKNDFKKDDSLFKVIKEEKVKFPITILNYADHTQEGRHRMFVAGELNGWDRIKYPVLVIKPTKERLQDEIVKPILNAIDNAFESSLDYTYKSFDEYFEEIKFKIESRMSYVDYDFNKLKFTKNDNQIIIELPYQVKYIIDKKDIDINPNKQEVDDSILDIDDLQ